MNPFSFGNPIKDPTLFYGRKAEIRQIVNRLLSSAHESTSVVGERRIGKTSLLNYLANPQVAKGFGLTPDKFCMIYLDFQGLTDITPQRFWQRVLSKLSKAVCDESLQPELSRLSQQTSFDLFDLEDLFQATCEKGLTIVLLLDEFEYVTQNPNFKSDFFGGLRALAIHHGVALIPSTRRELVDLCHSEELKGSPFFNIFANVVLRPFSPAETAELIMGYTSGGDLTLNPGQFDLVQRLGGGFPLFVQAAGYYVLDGKAQGLEGEALSNYVHLNFDQQSDSHFTYMWAHCSDSEKRTLVALLTMGSQNIQKVAAPTIENLTKLHPRAPQDLASMSKRGLIVERNGSFHPFSPAFEKWIKNELANLPGEEETAAATIEWAKAAGVGQNKEAEKILPKFKRKYWPLISEFLEEFTMKFAVTGSVEIIKALL